MGGRKDILLCDFFHQVVIVNLELLGHLALLLLLRLLPGRRDTICEIILFFLIATDRRVAD